MTPIRPTDKRRSPNHSARKERVVFLCVHWTAGSFEGSVSWCCNPTSEVSYARVIGPAGQVADLVPWSRASWSVGYARSPLPHLRFRSGNHASENIALAGGPPKAPTAQQRQLLIVSLVERMRAHGWGADQVWRILGHDQVAVFPPSHTKAGQFGRKDDPQGKGWLPLKPVRDEVAARLLAHAAGEAKVA